MSFAANTQYGRVSRHAQWSIHNYRVEACPPEAVFCSTPDQVTFGAGIHPPSQQTRHSHTLITFLF